VTDLYEAGDINQTDGPGDDVDDDIDDEIDDEVDEVDEVEWPGAGIPRMVVNEVAPLPVREMCLGKWRAGTSDGRGGAPEDSGRVGPGRKRAVGVPPAAEPV